MDRRKFIVNGCGLASGWLLTGNLHALVPAGKDSRVKYSKTYSHRLPQNDHHYRRTCGYVEDIPVNTYSWAPDSAYEDFQDIKFGIRLHWGIYSLLRLRGESWPYLQMLPEEKQTYQELYKSWYPAGFDAEQWVDFFTESGAKMFAFTSKHHDGFSMFDTSARVKRRVNWLAPGGPQIEECDLAYSIMETPFKRDIVKELTTAAHRKGMKVDLYFSHPDWYDSDFRPYNYHPLQVPDAATLAVTGKNRTPEIENPRKYFAKAGLVIKPDPSKEEITRMMARHRLQLEELLTKYGHIDMVCLDQWLGPEVWPILRDTMLHLRKISPRTMFRARGIGNYGDYYTPEGFVPGSKENSDTPWFVIHALGGSFSYEADEQKYKGASWVVKNLVDAVAKGGNFMAGIGPDGNGRFHPTAIMQLKETGKWLKQNGEGIYATRAREGDQWKEGDNIRFTRSKDSRMVYAFCYEWPGEQLVLSTVRPPKGAAIHFLGFEKALQWKYDSQKGLVISIPSEWKDKFRGAANLTYGLKIEMAH
jgi:alpha-L-fucosidase